MPRTSIIAAIAVVLVVRAVSAQAGELTGTNRMSSSKAGGAADHTIIFTTASGVDSSTDTITLTFEVGFSIGSISFRDVDLADDGVEKVLAARAAPGTWGAGVSGQVMTLTPPTDAPPREIAPSSLITVRVGTNATAGEIGANQITSPDSAGSYEVAVGGGFGDRHSLPVNVTDNNQVMVAVEHASCISLTIATRPGADGTSSTSAVVTSGAANYLSVTTRFYEANTTGTQTPGVHNSLEDARTAPSRPPGGAGLNAEIEVLGLEFETGCRGGPDSTLNTLAYRAVEMARSTVIIGGSAGDGHNSHVTRANSLSGTGGNGSGSVAITYIATANY
ncbi:MAG: hypothetical protein ACE5E0_03835 [Terriglobia bacterium]